MKSLKDYILEGQGPTGKKTWSNEKEISKKDLEDILKNVGMSLKLDEYKDGSTILQFFDNGDKEPSSAYIKKDGKFYFCSGKTWVSDK